MRKVATATFEFSNNPDDYKTRHILRDIVSLLTPERKIPNEYVVHCFCKICMHKDKVYTHGTFEEIFKHSSEDHNLYGNEILRNVGIITNTERSPRRTFGLGRR